MEAKLRIGIIIPTNNPTEFKEIMLPTLHHLSSLKRVGVVVFGLVVQSPWNMEDIKEVGLVIREFGFEFRFETSHSVGYMSRLRQEGFDLCSDCDYSFQLDDNLLFSEGTPSYQRDSGERYAEAIDYMEKNSNCGFIMCEGALGGSIQRYKISSTKTGFFSTARGLLFRKGASFPRESLDIKGGLEDATLCFSVIETGKYPAKQFNNPTQHKNKKKLEENSESMIHDINFIGSGHQKFIRERYSDPIWSLESRRLPIELINKYRQAGGINNLKHEVFNEIDYE